MDSIQDKMTAYYKYLRLVIIYSQGTQSCWSDNFLRLFDQVKTRISYTCYTYTRYFVGRVVVDLFGMAPRLFSHGFFDFSRFNTVQITPLLYVSIHSCIGTTIYKIGHQIDDGGPMSPHSFPYWNFLVLTLYRYHYWCALASVFYLAQVIPNFP